MSVAVIIAALAVSVAIGFCVAWRLDRADREYRGALMVIHALLLRYPNHEATIDVAGVDDAHYDVVLTRLGDTQRKVSLVEQKEKM